MYYKFASLYNGKRHLMPLHSFRLTAMTLPDLPVVYVLCFFKADLIFFHVILQLHHRIFAKTMKLHDFFFGII